MKTKNCILGIFAFVTLVVAAPHTWVLKTGEKVAGDYVSSGLTTLVVKTGGTNCFIKFSDLSTNDQSFIAKIQAAQKQARFDAETNQMVAMGMVEATANLIRDFPEKVSGIANDRQCWMDAKFIKIDSSYIADPDIYLGFQVEDKNGDDFYYCRMKKEFWGNEYWGANPLNFDYNNKKTNPLVGVVMSFKRGDKVRLIGRVIPVSNAASGVFDIGKI